MSLQKLTRPHEISLARKKLESLIMSHFKAPKGRYKTFKKCKISNVEQYFSSKTYLEYFISNCFNMPKITYLFLCLW